MKNKYYLPLLLTLNILSISAEQKNRSHSNEPLESASPLYALEGKAYSLDQDIDGKLQSYLQTDLSKEELAHKQYPFHEAVKADNLERVIALIQSGEHINTQDELGKTPLHYAIGKSNDILHALAAAGADFTIEDNEGKNPVDHAQERGSISLLWKTIEDLPFARNQIEYLKTLKQRSMPEANTDRI